MDGQILGGKGTNRLYEDEISNIISGQDRNEKSFILPSVIHDSLCPSVLDGHEQFSR